MAFERDHENGHEPKDAPVCSGDLQTSSSDALGPAKPLPEVKHPLEHSWTLWYFKNDRSKTWLDNLKEVSTFSTIEDFWALYHHTENASRMMVGCDYSIFKTGVKPMWEDPKNKAGGRWLINLDKKQRGNSLDNVWLEVLLCLIGESFGDDGEIVNGAVVSIRNRGDKLAVWLGNAKMASSVMHVGSGLKGRLGLGQDIQLGFESHEDTMHKAGSVAKNKYTV